MGHAEREGKGRRQKVKGEGGGREKENGEIKWERELWDDRSGKEQTLRGEDESRVDHGSSPSAGRAWSGHVVIDLKKLYIFIVCAFIGWTAARYVLAIIEINASRSRSLRHLAINV